MDDNLSFGNLLYYNHSMVNNIIELCLSGEGL